MNVVDATHPSKYELASKEAALRLLKDGVIVYPTDTLYGMGANALDPVAVKRLFEIKGRSEEKAVPVIVSSLAMARTIAVIESEKEPLLEELWPGPFTFVFKKQRIVPSAVTGGQETIALRIPDHPLCLSILRDFEGPITATSVNVSGEVPLRSAEEIVQRFEGREDRPDLILDAGELEEKNPSTIIDLTVSPPKILRVNPTNKEKLMQILKIMQ